MFRLNVTTPPPFFLSRVRTPGSPGTPVFVVLSSLGSPCPGAFSSRSPIPLGSYDTDTACQCQAEFPPSGNPLVKRMLPAEAFTPFITAYILLSFSPSFSVDTHFSLCILYYYNDTATNRTDEVGCFYRSTITVVFRFTGR